MNFELKQRLIAYAALMRLDKPVGILLLLWPTLWALWLAGNGQPPWFIVLIFVLGTCVMRSAGCVINDYADRVFDGHVTRTKRRPLPNGAVSVWEALVLFVGLMLIALCLVWQLNWLTIGLAVLGAVVTVIYPYMKRFFRAPQLVLGVAFSWGIPMAYAAQLGYVPGVAWLLFLICLLWVIIYDTLYAMVDRPDDVKIGIQSTAILFGAYDRQCLAGLQVIVLILLYCLGQLVGLHTPYYGALLVGAGLFGYQQWLIRTVEPQACFTAFRQSHWFGAVVFVGFWLGL